MNLRNNNTKMVIEGKEDPLGQPNNTSSERRESRV
jgi:hypothetical protein